jgi:hypothetical protein
LRPNMPEKIPCNFYSNEEPTPKLKTTLAVRLGIIFPSGEIFGVEYLMMRSIPSVFCIVSQQQNPQNNNHKLRLNHHPPTERRPAQQDF